MTANPRESEWLRLAKLNLKGNSLGLLSTDNWLRVKIHQLVNHHRFENTMSGCILLSCIQMAIEVPGIEQGTSLYDSLLAVELFTTGMFTLECMLKILELGFVVGPSTYLRSLWNQLDFFIVATSVMSLGLQFSSASANSGGVLDAVRVLRAVRPLRVISRSPNIQLVVQSLALSVMSMVHVRHSAPTLALP
jgi:voltage-dependent calcium channel L type alpha-1D